jgi:hypothetical protein
MEKKYFLFGSEICDAMEEDGIEAALKVAEEGGFATYYWDEHSTPSELLAEYDGWNSYMEITEADYIRFQNL